MIKSNVERGRFLAATREEERRFLRGLMLKKTLHILQLDRYFPDSEGGSPFSDDSAERKNYPVFSGCLEYFPDAIAEVCKLSKEGNDKHNPGEPLHWSRDKSNDHKDCIARHLMDGDWVELAWRALANAQVEIEKGYKR